MSAGRGVISAVLISASPLSTTSSSGTEREGAIRRHLDAADIAVERDVELAGTDADAAQVHA